ncbi:MAG: energy transducer TonB [Woeseiaceae bacterium]|nr:energy transducer TonB [Woeseiaceae bacterium]
MYQTSSVSKMPIVILTAVVVTILLFTAIEYLIGQRRVRLTEGANIEIANFIRAQEQSREVRSRRDPKAPEKPQQEMQQDLHKLQASSAGGMSSLDVDIPDIDLDLDLGGSIAIARELTPLVRIPADYPISALSKEIEGWVLIRFTVTETGSVADPEILRSEPPGVFDRSAKRAVLKWKYQPQIVDGKPAAVVTYTRLRFEMEKDED